MPHIVIYDLDTGAIIGTKSAAQRVLDQDPRPKIAITDEQHAAQYVDGGHQLSETHRVIDGALVPIEA